MTGRSPQTPLHQRVEDALDVAAVDAALRKIGAQLVSAITPTTLVDPQAEAEALIAGADLDVQDLVTRVGQQHLAATASQQVGMLLGHVAEKLKVERHTRARRNADKALHVLREAFDEVLVEARAVLPDIDHVNTAEQAIEWHAADSWRRAGELGLQLQTIRRLQAQVIAPAFDSMHIHPSVTIAVEPPSANAQRIATTFGAVEDYLEAWDDQAVPAGVMSMISGRDGEDSPEFPWLGQPLAVLRWTATAAEARPWIPTIRQLRDAVDERARNREAQRIANLPKRTVTLVEKQLDRAVDRAARDAAATDEARARAEMGRS